MSDFALTTPGPRVRAAREAAGLSQAELSRRLGCSPGAVWQIEADKCPATLDRLYEIATAIGCRPSDLDPRLTSRREPVVV
jgi:transcriptional regulator with XRE-family HTH domain